MTAKTWTITNINVYPHHEGEADVVCSASWNVSGTDGTYSGSLNGATAFKLNPDAEYIQFDQLTEEQVLSWVFDSLGEESKATAEADVDAQIAYAASQAQAKPMPWANA